MRKTYVWALSPQVLQFHERVHVGVRCASCGVIPITGARFQVPSFFFIVKYVHTHALCLWSFTFYYTQQWYPFLSFLWDYTLNPFYIVLCCVPRLVWCAARTTHLVCCVRAHSAQCALTTACACPVVSQSRCKRSISCTISSEWTCLEVRYFFL